MDCTCYCDGWDVCNVEVRVINVRIYCVCPEYYCAYSNVRDVSLSLERCLYYEKFCHFTSDDLNNNFMINSKIKQQN